MILCAALWDAAALLLPGASRLPQVSHAAIAAGAGAACVALLLVIMQRRKSLRRVIAAELAAVGLLLVAWLVRGHPAIPPDPPIVAAQLCTGVAVLWSARRLLR